MHKTLFSGRDIALEVYDGGHPISIITFDARGKNRISPATAKFGPGFGRGRFREMGFNELLIKRSWNHWYQSEEMIAAAEIANRLTRGTRVVTYGGSMGGFAAINFAPMLNADSFIALSPLHDIEAGNEADETRWPEGAVLNFPFNFIKNGLCRDAKGYAFYCAHSLDKTHAELLKRDTSATLMPVEYGAHPCSFYLNDTYKLKPLVRDIATEQFSLEEFYRVLKARTPETFYPYARLSVQFEKAGDIQAATEQARIAHEKAPHIEQLNLRLGNLLFERGDLDQAEAAFRGLILRHPDSVTAYVRLSYILAARRDFKAAVAQMAIAVSIKPDRHDLHVRLGEWLIRAGDLAAAVTEMEKAIELRPDGMVAKSRLRAVQAKIAARARLAKAKQASVEQK